MIRCWYYRWRLACLVDDQDTACGSLRRHVKACASCRAHYESQRVVAQALSQGRAIRVETEPGGIDPAVPFKAPVYRQKTHRFSLRTAAMAAGLLVLVGWGVSHYRQTAARKASADALLGMVTAPTELATNWMGAQSNWLDQPYAREVERLSSDANRAIRFLAQCTVNPLTFAGRPQRETEED